MTIDAGLETPRPPAGRGFSDAITFAFGDEAADVYGLARVGLADGAGSGLGVLFAGRSTAAARAEGGVAVSGDGWEGVAAGGVTTATAEPLQRWTVAFDADADGAFALEFTALGLPAEIEGGGMTGYEQLCRVSGTARVAGRSVAIDCLGQRGHSWGSPDWDRMSMARTVGAWLDPALAVVISAIRPSKASDHAHDDVRAVVLEGSPPAPVAVGEPRLSTAFDADGHQRRAGWELWPDDEEGYARRGAGEVLCGTSLDLGRLRLDCAFFRFRMDGREGVGRYDVLRRT
ncbi:DUF7064 domain-containing protein [Capillimicrobium parvum]|uniref:DUF7064 domain-containing protein n=1 Tax=Capillimicrobium parvum TaxID=2884022 RepID=A0A9E7C2U5_9ACTN|nr:hypothetical protein [Capillimicrobium parvum]UGS37783.1 hypothetical protein DSM104329_04204 [Capillimicrobium parvum]